MTRVLVYPSPGGLPAQRERVDRRRPVGGRILNAHDVVDAAAVTRPPRLHEAEAPRRPGMIAGHGISRRNTASLPHTPDACRDDLKAAAAEPAGARDAEPAPGHRGRNRPVRAEDSKLVKRLAQDGNDIGRLNDEPAIGLRRRQRGQRETPRDATLPGVAVAPAVGLAPAPPPPVERALAPRRPGPKNRTPTAPKDDAPGPPAETGGGQAPGLKSPNEITTPRGMNGVEIHHDGGRTGPQARHVRAPAHPGHRVEHRAQKLQTDIHCPHGHENDHRENNSGAQATDPQYE